MITHLACDCRAEAEGVSPVVQEAGFIITHPGIITTVGVASWVTFVMDEANVPLP